MYYNATDMTTITILPEKADSYRALAGDKESTGRTAGEALDALTSQLADDEGGTLVIVQNHKADKFFNAAQQSRLTELMQCRQARTLSSEEERELESLVEAELEGARRRTEWKITRLYYWELSFKILDLAKSEVEIINLLAGAHSINEMAKVLNIDRKTAHRLISELRRRTEKSLSHELTKKSG
jgi:DNA-binding CsgD family transcriptional regulator